jgi:hypothetical protein
MKKEVIKGFKGFDKDLRCRDKQYAIGETFTEDDTKLCEYGMHFCVNPHDIFGYYEAGNNNRFCEVEASDVSDERENDSKRVAKTLFVKAEISVFQICKIAVSTFFENFGFKKKIESADCNEAGYNGVAIVSNDGKVKGGLGCILVARNIEYNYDANRYEVSDWACAIVDNNKIKADTWYHLIDGELKEYQD